MTSQQKADNYVFFLERIVEDRYPNAKDWQKAVIIHAERGLMNKYHYDQARSIYHHIKTTKNNDERP